MRYEKTFPTRQPKERLRALAERFARLNFRIEEHNDHLLRLSGPGMWSTKQDPLTAIRRAEVRTEGAAIYVDLRMVNVTRIFVRILCWVFIPLILVFGVTPFVLSEASLGPARATSYWLTVGLSIGGNLLLWMILLPFIGRVFRRRVIGAVETLFANLEKL